MKFYSFYSFEVSSIKTPFILFLGQTKEHQGRISIVYRGVWNPEKRMKKKRKKIDIALKVFKSDHHSIEVNCIDVFDKQVIQLY